MRKIPQSFVPFPVKNGEAQGERSQIFRKKTFTTAAEYGIITWMDYSVKRRRAIWW